MKHDSLKVMLRAAFEREKVICRLIAAWCTFAAITLLTAEGKFFELSFAQNTSTVSLLLIVGLFFIIYSAVAALLGKYQTDTWFLLAAATVCVIRWLSDFESDGSKNNFLFLLAVIVAYCLFLYYFIMRNTEFLDRLQPNRKVVTVFAAVCGLIGGIVIAVITCLRYKTFSSPNFDFGLFCQMFHSMKTKGLPMITCERNVYLSHFVVHISPIYYLLLPFYFIFPSPMTLQIAQAVVLASGVIPVLLLCRHYKVTGKTTMLLCMMWAFYPALSAGCFYDIHENCFLAPLLLWLFYFFEKDKPIPMYIFAVLTLMVKEDAAIYVILFALYVLLARKKYLHGTILAAGSLAWFLIAMAILTKTAAYYAQYYQELGLHANPAIAGPMVNRFNNIIYDAEDGLGGAVHTALTNPGYLLTQLFTINQNYWKTATNAQFEKLVYFFQMFLPLGMLPFCTKKPSRWLLITPVLMNLLTYYQYQYNIGFQYQFGITAFLFYVTIQNVPELAVPTRRNLVSFGAAACLCMYIVTVLPRLGQYTARWRDGKDTYTKMTEILDTLPDDASLNVSTYLVAYCSDHDVLYEINYHGDQPDVDFVVFDARYNYKEHYDAYIKQGYTVYAEYDKLIVILQKGE